MLELFSVKFSQVHSVTKLALNLKSHPVHDPNVCSRRFRWVQLTEEWRVQVQPSRLSYAICRHLPQYHETFPSEVLVKVALKFRLFFESAIQQETHAFESYSDQTRPRKQKSRRTLNKMSCTAFLFLIERILREDLESAAQHGRVLRLSLNFTETNVEEQ